MVVGFCFFLLGGAEGVIKGIYREIFTSIKWVIWNEIWDIGETTVKSRNTETFPPKDKINT